MIARWPEPDAARQPYNMPLPCFTVWISFFLAKCYLSFSQNLSSWPNRSIFSLSTAHYSKSPGLCLGGHEQTLALPGTYFFHVDLLSLACFFMVDSCILRSVMGIATCWSWWNFGLLRDFFQHPASAVGLNLHGTAWPRMGGSGLKSPLVDGLLDNGMMNVHLFNCLLKSLPTLSEDLRKLFWFRHSDTTHSATKNKSN